MPHDNLVIITVMGRGDLQGSGTEFALDMVIENNRQNAVGEGQFDTDLRQTLVPLVIRMHGNGRITNIIGYRDSEGTTSGDIDATPLTLFHSGSETTAEQFSEELRYAGTFGKADVIVIVGTPFDFRMGYGKRISSEATLVQIDMDYRTVGKNRDISLGLVGDPGAILQAALDATTGRTDNGSAGRQGWLDELRAEEVARTEKLMPLFMADQDPIHPYRLAWEINEFLTEDTI